MRRIPGDRASTHDNSGMERDVIKISQLWNNFVRFHSHCEPEAAFAAADELGMLLQPELSHWDPKEPLERRKAIGITGQNLWTY